MSQVLGKFLPTSVQFLLHLVYGVKNQFCPSFKMWNTDFQFVSHLTPFIHTYTISSFSFAFSNFLILFSLIYAWSSLIRGSSLSICLWLSWCSPSSCYRIVSCRESCCHPVFFFSLCIEPIRIDNLYGLYRSPIIQIVNPYSFICFNYFINNYVNLINYFCLF